MRPILARLGCCTPGMGISARKQDCTASDTCAGECVTNPQARKPRPVEGVAIRQTKGPSLFLLP